jgi:hypothetical protein
MFSSQWFFADMADNIKTYTLKTVCSCYLHSVKNGGLVGLWCLMPLLTIFQFYHGGQVLLVEESRVPGENHRPVASH